MIRGAPYGFDSGERCLSNRDVAAPALRIGNASGFYGDRFAAMAEMLDGGPLDVLTGDYLAELTMLILGRDRQRDPRLGYAKTFLRQLEHCLGTALDRGVRIVTNAGGVNPAGLADAVRELARTLHLDVQIAHVQGDDLRDQATDLGLGEALTANAYLGAWGIAACLDAGADIVVTGRVTDASLAVGPAAAHFGWERTHYDALAGAVVAGHVLECGAQATGGNYSFFADLPDIEHPGFPVAEIYPDGSSVITKHDGTGGAVTVGTVTAQLLYEISGGRYVGPDVTARFDTIQLSQVEPDRVAINGVRGEPPPSTVKVGLNEIGGYRNEVDFVLTGLDIDAKAILVERQLRTALRDKPPAQLEFQLPHTEHEDTDSQERASTVLRCIARDSDRDVVGRALSGAAVELVLASYPGCHLLAPPTEAQPYGVFSAAYVDAGLVPHLAVLPDGSVRNIAPPGETMPLCELPEPAVPPPYEGRLARRPLGTVIGARSGDKGGTANLGVWVHDAAHWPWLVHTLTVDQLKRLLPETAALPVTRHVLENLHAMNFVIDRLLGLGVAYAARFDPQAKGLGEWLRSRSMDVPT